MLHEVSAPNPQATLGRESNARLNSWPHTALPKARGRVPHETPQFPGHALSSPCFLGRGRRAPELQDSLTVDQPDGRGNSASLGPTAGAVDEFRGF